MGPVRAKQMFNTGLQPLLWADFLMVQFLIIFLFKFFYVILCGCMCPVTSVMVCVYHSVLVEAGGKNHFSLSSCIWAPVFNLRSAGLCGKCLQPLSPLSCFHIY